MKDKIIETALKEWGKNNYTKTSLSFVAKALGITKPAIYRYFKSKGDLIDAIVEKVIQEHRQLRLKLEKFDGSKAGAEKIFKQYLKNHLRFYFDHPERYYFLMYRMVSIQYRKSEHLIRFQEEEQVFLYRFFEDCGFASSKEQKEQAFRFINSSAFFWLSLLFDDFKEKKVSPGSVSEHEIDEFVQWAYKMIMDGVEGPPVRNIDVASMLKACAVKQEDMLPKDRLFSAIEEVMDREDVHGVSMEKIAEAAGMTKSSLYFHFKNRKEMLEQTLYREREHFGRLFLRISAPYAGLEELTCAYIVAAFTYSTRNSAFIKAFSWLKSQEVTSPLQRPGPDDLNSFYHFLEPLSKKEGMEKVPVFLFGFYLHSLTVWEVLYRIMEEEPFYKVSMEIIDSDLEDEVAALYYLFLGGLKSFFGIKEGKSAKK